MAQEFVPLETPLPKHGQRIDGHEADEYGLDPDYIVKCLESYRNEAEEARKGGPGERDDVWAKNIELYWNRMDFSEKASWQSQEVLPEASMYVDRWAAAMREALNAGGEWYDIKIALDDNKMLADPCKKFLNYWLKKVGLNQSGHPIEFSAVFEDQMKLGAIAAACAVVTWRPGSGHKGGYVHVDTTDPRDVWIDPTGRGLYRFRKIVVDKHQLAGLKGLQDEKGEPIYNEEDLERLLRDLGMAPAGPEEENRNNLVGHKAQAGGKRQEVVLHEYIATVVDEDGTPVYENAHFLVANHKHLIRGPERNPFWHKRDWLVYSPLVTVPLSVYGRSYMESFSSVARTFIEMTNLIIDGTMAAALNAFAVNVDMLEDAGQLKSGVHPNKLFHVNGDPKQFVEMLQLGRIPGEVVQVWQGIKQELREGAAFSEIALGQLPPKGDITATEIVESQRGSSALVRSIARTIEARFLEPLLNLIWNTALQHFDPADPELIAAVGAEYVEMFSARRREFAQNGMIRVEGISALIERGQKLRNLLAALNVFAGNPLMLQAFMQEYSMPKVMSEVLRLFNVDAQALQMTAQERLQASMMAAINGQAAPGAEPGGTTNALNRATATQDGMGGAPTGG